MGNVGLCKKRKESYSIQKRQKKTESTMGQVVELHQPKIVGKKRAQDIERTINPKTSNLCVGKKKQTGMNGESKYKGSIWKSRNEDENPVKKTRLYCSYVYELIRRRFLTLDKESLF